MAATIKDVAGRAGLSVATISKYLNGGNIQPENRLRIEEAVTALGYRVNETARGLKTNRTMTVGALLPRLDNVFFNAVVSGAEDLLMERGYGTIVCDYREDPLLERDKLRFLVGKRVDGLLVAPLGLSNEEIREIAGVDCPVVLIDRLSPGAPYDAVTVDNLNATYHAVEQLIARGHRRIGVICGPPGIYTAQERLKGYLRAHEDYGLTADPALIRHGVYDARTGHEQCRALLDLDPRPTAVFATSYDLTLGAIIALNERNVVLPGDISFIGFDDLQLAKVYKPALAMVTQPVREIAVRAAELLLRRLAGDRTGFPAVIRLKTEVVLRESVGEGSE